MQRSLLLDLFRIAAISLVLIAHFGQLFGHASGGFFGIKNFYYVSLGGLGVSLFLLLSGILAGLSDAHRYHGYYAYLLKKILRIYPLYWLSLPISFIAFILGGWILDGSIPELFPNGLLGDLLLSLTGFYSWFGLWGGPYNSPTWFIALIMAMYALFPLLLMLLKRWALPTLAALLIVSVVSRYLIGLEGVPFSDQSFFANLKSWAYRQYGFMPGRPGDWFPLCRVFEFGLGVYLGMRLPKGFWFAWRLPGQVWIGRLGDLAFAVFLLHFPLLFLVQWWVDLGLIEWLAILLFMALVLGLAQALTELDQKFPRTRMQALLGG